MTCSNCYNGCTDIISDRCVKYTGIDIPVLEIKTGDSLSYVNQALIEFLTSTLDGTGIKPDIDPAIICELVETYLPDCGDISIVDLISALIKSVCSLQEQITAVVEDLEALEGNYDVDCLTGVQTDSGTHAILQAVITKLCENEATLEALALTLDTEYVKLADLDDLIAAYLENSSSLVSNKMIPYVAVEYYGSLNYFDQTGAGTGDWLKIYLCNGDNGTPDKRGRIPVGTTTGMGGGAFNPAVDPAIIGNPTYILQAVAGANNIVLAASQIPSHTHVAISLVTDTHFHYEFANIGYGTGDPTSINYPHRSNSWGGGNDFNYRIGGSVILPTIGKSGPTVNAITVATTNANSGGGLSHSNIQPVLACHYIMYIP